MSTHINGRKEFELLRLDQQAGLLAQCVPNFAPNVYLEMPDAVDRAFYLGRCCLSVGTSMPIILQRCHKSSEMLRRALFYLHSDTKYDLSTYQHDAYWPIFHFAARPF